MKRPVGMLVLPFQEGVSKVYSNRSLPIVGVIEGISEGAGNFPNETGLYAYLQGPNSNIGGPR